uniref:SusC/RagA family TonB-linked outer membrane protein n=1 Tax=Bacteroides thetaiotaomicron TaxID=818 RepID=UPI00359CB1BF
MESNSFKNNRKAFVALLLCTGFIASHPLEMMADSNGTEVQSVQQQKQSISGIVKDASGEPVIGVSILEKGTGNGTITDLDGRFTINVNSNAILVISYIGYKTIEVKATPNMSLTLKEDTEMLDEVVVVGFGTQKKVNLTGAVDVVDNKQLSERPVSNAVQALQGVAPGLQIIQSSGSIESRPSINVRGTATIGQGTSGNPLILIDGMEADLNSINPQDIESISVLKDAAASSIYGSRAPFGVILVTTKSGRDGKVTINYNNSFRFGTPVHMNKMMNSVDFASWMNNTFQNNGEGNYFGRTEDGDSNNRFNEIVAYHNARPYSNGVRIADDGSFLYGLPKVNSTGQWQGAFSTGVDDMDWYDMLYKDWAFSQEHNFSASGGTKKFSYYASGSFFDQNGFLEMGKENLKRYTATAKINSELTSWLKFRYSMRFTREDQERPAALTDGLYDSMGYKAWPVIPAYDQNGNPFFADDTSVWALEYGGSDRTQTDNIYHQLGFTIEPIKNWLTNVDFNYRIKSANRHWDKLPYYNYDIDGNPYFRNSSSNVHEDYLKNNYYNFNVRSEYSFSLHEKHNFHLMGGMQIEDLKETKFGLQRSGLIIDGKPEINMTTGWQNGEAVTPDTNGERNQWATVGIFGRFNYDYKSRYLFEANVRGDGSSRFRKGHQWKVFPSFSLGWNLAEENFMKNTRSWLDMFKIRLSYGSLGNQNTDNWYYTYITMSASPTGSSWLQNGQKVPTATAPGLVSENLTWETIETYNVGVDWAFLSNRLTGSFNWYIRNTKDMVGKAPRLPEILGTGVPSTNNTDLRTQGWELTLGWRDQLSNGLSYGAKFILYDSRTKITRYPNNPTRSNDTYVEGRYINEIWGYETIGLAKTDEEMQNHLATLPKGGQDALGSKWSAGDIMYKDLNGDGKISGGSGTVDDPGDRKVIGNSTPRFQFGLDMNASWKGFDVRVFFQGVMKRDYWQGSNYLFGATGGGQWNAVGITSVADYFRDENTWSVQQGINNVNLDSYLPRPLYSNKNFQTQTRYLQNAAYIRLKNLTIGYTLPESLTQKWGIGRTRIFFSGENLWTGTKLAEQFDPETIGTNKGNAYPLSTTLSCGLSLTF